MQKKLIFRSTVFEAGSDISRLLSAFDNLAYGKLHSTEEVTRALASALVRLTADNGKELISYYGDPQSDDFDDYAPALADILKRERARALRVDYLLEEAPEGGWRIRSECAGGPPGDEEVMFRAKAGI